MAEKTACPHCGGEIPTTPSPDQCPHCGENIDAPQSAAPNPTADLSRDRNLLFGVFALQLRFIEGADFLDAAAAWTSDPARDVSERLVESGKLSSRDRKLVESLIEEAVQQHDGDLRKTLERFGGERAFTEHLSRVSINDADRGAVTRLGIPLDTLDLDADSVSAVLETPGRYSKNSEYSRGGMGRILLVYDEYLSRDIALKELIPPPEQTYSGIEGGSPVRAMSSLVLRFLREAKLTGQLEHPSIVPVYELGRRPNGTLYYTMKLVRGQTLAQALRQVKTLRERLTYLTHFVDLCQAVGYAHSRNVIHRDIKPTNVMIGEFGETVVIDWGLAKVVGQTDIHEDELRDTWSRLRGRGAPDPGRTAAGTMLGTPYYMAPEQAKGHIDEIDQRTDVFALGVVLYEILTGKLPFRGQDTRAVIKKVIESDPKPIDHLEPGVAPELAGICARAMNKEASARYADAQALALDVQHFLTGAVVDAYEYSPQEVMLRVYRRHRALVHGVAVAVLAVIATGVASYIQIRDARDLAIEARNSETTARVAESDARAVAQDKTYVSELRLAQQYAEARHFDLARQTLWKTDPARRDWAWGFLLNRLEQDLFTIPGFNTAVVSPDNQRIAARSNSHPVSIFDAYDGSLLLEFDPLTQRFVYELEFSPDGRFIIAGCADRAVRVWDAQTGELVHTLRGHRNTPYTATYSADQSKILSVGGQTARVWDAETGDSLTVFRGHCAGDPQCKVWRGGFIPQTPYAYSYSDNEIIRVWNSDSAEEFMVIEGRRPGIDPNGDRIVVPRGISADVWNINTGTRDASLSGHQAFIDTALFSPDGDYIVTASKDNTLRVWNAATGEETRQFSHPGAFHRLAFSTDGRLLACINGEGLIKIWEFDTGEELKSVNSQNSLAYSIQFYDNNRKLMTAARESQIMTWGVHSGFGLNPVASLESPVRHLSISENDQHLAVVSDNNIAYQFDANAGAIQSALTSFNYRFNHPVAISPSGRYLVAATDPFIPFLLDTRAGFRIQPLVGHSGKINSLDYSADGKFILSTSSDESARIWDGVSGTPLRTLEGHGDRLNTGVFSPDSSRILTSSEDGTARIWTLDGIGQVVLEGHEGPVQDATWAPDGSILATSGDDKTLRFWNADDGSQLGLIERAGTSSQIRFHPDGELLFARSGVGDAVVYRVDTGEQLVGRLAFEPITPSLIQPTHDGRSLLIAGMSQNTVWRMDAAPWRLADLPGSESAPWSARYDQYRVEQREHAAPAAQSDIPTVIVTTTNTLRARIARFRDVLAAEGFLPGDAGGLLIDGERQRTLARLCLRTGDRVLAIDDVQISTPESARTALDRWLQTQSDNLRWTVRRGELTFTANLVTVPIIESRQVLTLDRASAITILSSLLNARGGSLDATNQLSDEFITASGEIVEPDTLYGFYFSLSTDYDDSAKLGLTQGDWIRKIDGEPIANVQHLIDFVSAVVEQLEDGEDRTVTIEAERGEFLRFTNEIQIR